MLAIVDLENFIQNIHKAGKGDIQLLKNNSIINDCNKIVSAFSEMGAVIIKDPRVHENDNSKFIDLMEEYFALDTETKMLDARPEIAYQVGVTPAYAELPRCANQDDKACKDFMKKLKQENLPTPVTQKDPKWRFFWRIGERKVSRLFPEFSAAAVIPKGFPNWSNCCDNWGNQLMNTIFTVSEMLAIGFNLPRNTFTSLLNGGPHLLAPTGSDLLQFENSHSTKVLAGFHTDINFLSIHGKSRYPGLSIWTKQGQRLPVKVPEGYLLLQAGKQLEHLTGGAIKAGFHEVVCDENTQKAIQEAKAKGKKHIWRVSSTLFSHVQPDVELVPLLSSCNEDSKQIYEPILAGKHVLNELQHIKLAI